jgi:SPP1 family predicted phage head-tail adaptor
VRIDELVQTQNPTTGAMVDSWKPFATVWASLEPLSGREFIAASATQSKVDTRAKMHKMDGINASMRLVNTRNQIIYNIHAVLPDPKSGEQWQTLLLSSGVNSG